MGIPSHVKEVKQLTESLTALSRFLSCAVGKAFHFFSTPMENERFEWTNECEQAFTKFNVFLASLHILMHPITSSHSYLYLSVTGQALSLVLVYETNEMGRHVYFVSKVFMGIEGRYHKIDRLMLAVVVTTRKLKPYFQEHQILVKTYYLVCLVLKKPYMPRRMVSWAD